MESQFKMNFPGALLGDLGYPFPEGTHAVGRLDKPSEGLLLLTTNKRITRLLFLSAVPHARTYLVQVKGDVQPHTLEQLRSGVRIRLSGDAYYTTPPCEVSLAEAPDFSSPREFAFAHKTTWLRITLTEGKYRQVRKMVAAVGHRCFRLVRTAIEDLTLGDLQPGEVRELSEAAFFQKLKLG